MNSLSVLITYHNEKELLGECLASILSQKEGPEEVLIYDDASSDPAQNYVPKDSRVRVIRGEKNAGPSEGRNHLLREAKGAYVHFHDADDWFHPDWAWEVRSAISKRHASAVFTEVSSYNEAGSLHMASVLGLKSVADHDSLIRFCIRRFMLVPAGTFKKSFLEETGGYRTDLWQSEDYEFHIRVALALGTFELILEPLVNIRLRKESRSRNRIETNRCALEAIMMLKGEVPKGYWGELAEKASSIGRELYALGDKKNAKAAFKVAKKLGPPRFEDQSPFYRAVARSLGQSRAEWLGEIYRKKVPDTFRKRLR